MVRLVFFLLCALVLAACIEARRIPPKLGKKCPLAKCVMEFHKTLRPPRPRPGMAAADLRQLIEGAENVVDMGTLVDELPVDPIEVIPAVKENVCKEAVNGFLSCAKDVASTESLCECPPRALLPLIMAKEFPVAFKTKHCKLAAPKCDSHRTRVVECMGKFKEAKKAIKEYAPANRLVPLREWPVDISMMVENALMCIDDLHNATEGEEECKVKIPLLRIRPLLAFTVTFIKSLGCRIPKRCMPRKPVCDFFEADVYEDECGLAANNSACGMIEDFPHAAIEVLRNIKEKKCAIAEEVLYYKHEMGCDVKLPFEFDVPDISDETMPGLQDIGDETMPGLQIASRAKGTNAADAGKSKGGKSKGKPKHSGESKESGSSSMTTPEPTSEPSETTLKTLSRLLKRLLQN